MNPESDPSQPVYIALIGNPNCGKTSLFNALTGARQYVGNRPGVTIDMVVGHPFHLQNVTIEDLPGIYSLSPYSEEEVVSRDLLIKKTPSVIINVLDGTNLERNLFLTSQLCELNIPIVCGVNMIDLVRKSGNQIDVQRLSEELGCPVLEISALKKEGLTEITEKAIQQSGNQALRLNPCVFDVPTERAISEITTLIQGHCKKQFIRWHAIKAFERDETVLKSLNLNKSQRDEIERITQEAESIQDNSSDKIISKERYAYIANIVKKCFSETDPGVTISDRVDSIVTNRWLSLPIFALVMWGIYYLSIQTIGSKATDWVNDVLFGEIIPNALTLFFDKVGCTPWLQDMILNGIIAGVGAVLGFLPQVAILFFSLALLEDFGYMARAAFVMDRLFRWFGLSGKSFIPLLVASGCGVPGLMTTRTIENLRDRRITLMVTTFIPCSAKLPIIALIAGAFFRESTWVAPSVYLVGIAAVIFTGLISKRISALGGEPAPFIMELPPYHLPMMKSVLLLVWRRCLAFVKKAGTVILVGSALIWFLSNYSFGLQEVTTDKSMLAAIGGWISPIFIPLGWGDWRLAVATITGLVAKENLVSTIGILYGVEEVSESGNEIWSHLGQALSQPAAYSLLVFNLLCAPCIAAMATIYREMNSLKWTLFTLAYQTCLAYLASLMIYLGFRLFF